MVVNSIRRVMVAVVLCLSVTGVAGGIAVADTTPVTTDPSGPFTPPYQAG
ncbi:hypothetical protein [Umezawaea tangerina]|uniref:Uncharacterized protein n=1 Tax=Umezawaea tangerina TaxID=84725 RepID=A0A2T0SSH9_9PSEU|nr:hypothetical protein [Umezawaea tangerina]PRY36371.1 hypothetical protein CLV43_112299 [Umezawaea tangerina]